MTPETDRASTERSSLGHLTLNDVAGRTSASSLALRPYVTPILRIVQDTPRIKSFKLRAPAIAKAAHPGQFLMVWIPGVDEIPMSISAADSARGYVEFAVTRLGDATTRLHEARQGTLLGIRGPLGHGFQIPPVNRRQRLLIIGGGCGASPLHFLAQRAVSKGWKVDAVLGARTKAELLYHTRLVKLAATVVTTTEDGTHGLQGTAINGAEHLLGSRQASRRYAACFACGPEPMLVALAKLAKSRGIPLQLSLERYMKCGVGLCAHCVIDGQGTRVCIEGPVFDAKQLRNTDFGKSNRDATGLRQPLPSSDETCST